MILLLAHLARLGKLLVEEGKLQSPDISTLDVYYAWRDTDAIKGIGPKLVQDQPLKAPRRVLKGSGNRCDRLADNAKFFLRTRDLKGQDPFWDQLDLDLKDNDDPQVTRKVKALRKCVSDQWRTVEAGTQGTVTYYHLVPKGSRTPKPLTQKPTAKNMESLGVISDSIPIVMFIGGVAITTLLKSWWTKTCKKNRKKSATHRDLITGEPCAPVQTHDRIKTIDAPLLSYNKDTFKFGRLVQGLNFPVSQETHDQFRDGFIWVTEYEHGQAVTLHDEGASTLQAGWWPEGCTDHPLLPLLTKVLNGGTKEEVVVAWEDLRKLKVDQTLFHFGIWRHSKSRFALVQRWEIPADKLKANLLQFHQEWAGSFEYVAVRWIITMDDPRPAIPVALYEAVFKAVILGGPYPEILLTHVANHYHPELERFLSIWTLSTHARRIGVPMLNGKPKKYQAEDFEGDRGAPTLDELLDRQTAGLAGTDLQNYYYGLLLSAGARIEFLYHFNNFKKEKDTGYYPRRFAIPGSFISRQVGLLEVYRSWLKEHFNSDQFRALSIYYDQLSSLIIAPVLIRYSANRGTYVNFGWTQGQAFFTELANYYNQRYNHEKETRPKKAGNGQKDTSAAPKPTETSP